MKKLKSLEAVYIYIYIVKSKKISILIIKKLMYFNLKLIKVQSFFVPLRE